MTLQQLTYFREIASTLNFTQAAENLYVSQPNLSHAIRALERELGVPLFDRQNGKKVLLTSYGKEFLPYAERSFAALEEGVSHLRQMQNPLSGVVRIAYGYVNGTPLVSSLFQQYFKDNPDSGISLQFQINDGSRDLVQMLRDGETDLLFIAQPSFDGLNSIPVATQELVVYLPKEHPLASRASLTVEDIQDELLYGYHPEGNLIGRIQEIFADCGLRPNFADFLPTWTEEISYISMGLGIGILPRIPVDGKEIATVPLEHPMSQRKLYLHWPKEPNLSPAAEHILQYCIRYFQNRRIEDA